MELIISTDREQYNALLQAERDELGFLKWLSNVNSHTHGYGCWSWSPRHHMCALTEIARLNLRLETHPSGIDGISARDVTIREQEKEIAAIKRVDQARQEPNALLLAAVQAMVAAEDEADAARVSRDFGSIKSDYDAIIRQCRAALTSVGLARQAPESNTGLLAALKNRA